jgi:hypothetical protein
MHIFGTSYARLMAIQLYIIINVNGNWTLVDFFILKFMKNLINLKVENHIINTSRGLHVGFMGDEGGNVAYKPMVDFVIHK